MTTFQGYLFAEGTYTALEFYIYVNQKYPKPPRVWRKKEFTYVLKQQGIRPKSISNFEGLYLTFPFNKNHQICTKT